MNGYTLVTTRPHSTHPELFPPRKRTRHFCSREAIAQYLDKLDPAGDGRAYEVPESGIAGPFPDGTTIEISGFYG